MSELIYRDHAKPFIKWVGGKSQLLKEIRNAYPAELGKRINKYAEPFIGGGAVLFDVLNNYDIEEVYISDINKELINTYVTIRDSAYELIEILSEFEQKYINADIEERKKIFYEKRARFNEVKDLADNNIELSALFIFLNKTCFNGLYRVNGKGEFNVPQGSYKRPCICDTNNLMNVSKKLANVTISCGDYRQASCFIDSKTFAYFDPPYRPLTSTSNFTSYTKDGFDDEAQIELARFIDELGMRGAQIVASNSDPKNVDENDTFFDNLYEKHRVMRVRAGRALNSNVAKRGKVSELLIVNG